MEIIKVTTKESIIQAYKDGNVSVKRIDGLDSKFTTIPDNFKVIGLTFPEIKIGKEMRVVPSLALEGKGTIPVGQLFASHCGNTPKASKITKKGSLYENKYLVSNSLRVNSIAENKSEAEFIEFIMDKSFMAQPSQNFNVYSGFNNESVLTFHDSEAEALKGISPKGYRVVTVVA